MKKFTKKGKVTEDDLKDVIPWEVDPDVTAILDLDQICYVVASACQETFLEYTNKLTDAKGLFKNKTQFKDFMQGIDFDPETFESELFQKPEKIGHAISTLKRRIDNILKQVKCHPDNVELYVGGKDNFRDKLPLPKRYKHVRGGTVLPVLLRDLKQYCADYLGAEVIDGKEVDDVISTRMYEGYKSGEKVIGISTDKDNRMTSGWLFIPDKSTEPMYIDGFGSLYIDKSGSTDKVRGTGRMWLYMQCLIGDKVDGLCPRDIYEQLHGEKTRFGEKTAYNLIKGCKNDKEVLAKVVSQYKKWYGEDEFSYKDWTGKTHKVTWVDVLELYFLGVWMRQSENDTMSMKKILKKMGMLDE